MLISHLATFALLVGLELVLGIDNILLISILTDRLAEHQRNRARIVGLTLALVVRCLLLLGASALLRLNEPAVFGLSWKSLILLSGGGFLIFKAVKEIHHVVEGMHDEDVSARPPESLAAVIAQIILLDIVFSIDSIITAVGLTDELLIIYAAVAGSFVLVLMFAQKVATFVRANPGLKILALSFLVTIGVTLCVEAFDGHVNKGYIYLPMGFALAVELLQMRRDRNARRSRKA